MNISKTYVKSKVDRYSEKCLKFGRKAEFKKSEYFTKKIKNKKIKNFGRELTHPASAKSGGVGCNLPYIPINR